MRTSLTSMPRSSASCACARGQVRWIWDARPQVGATPAKAAKELVKVILRRGVLALQQPGPQALPDLVVGVRADLSEVIA